MIKVLMERDMPPGFDAADEAQASRHARIALDAVTATAGKMHWLCTYATGDRKLFGLVVVESEDVITGICEAGGVWRRHQNPPGCSRSRSRIGRAAIIGQRLASDSPCCSIYTFSAGRCI
jgi:hypothetical protein